MERPMHVGIAPDFLCVTAEHVVQLEHVEIGSLCVATVAVTEEIATFTVVADARLLMRDVVVLGEGGEKASVKGGTRACRRIWSKRLR